MSAATLKALAVVAELTGTELSAGALRVMESDLSAYPDATVMAALELCRREITGRLTLPAILERVERMDGRPGPEEAWALALQAADESETVVWTEETAAAFAHAMPLLEARDKVGARMAFKEAYEKSVRQSRLQASPARWIPSMGSDPERREIAVSAAVQAGKLPRECLPSLLPAPRESSPLLGLLNGHVPAGLLEGPKDDVLRVRRHLERVRSHLASINAKRIQAQRDEDAQHRAKIERMAAAKTEALDAVRKYRPD